MRLRHIAKRMVMPDYPHIDRYHRELAELIEFGGADNEENIRPAFQNCLAAYCADHGERLVLVPELRSDRSNKPDGTVRDSLRMTRGLWEAKDPHDDLDREIQNKLAQGYPSDNILFEDSRTAVLFQNQQEAMRVEMSDPAGLDWLVRRFLDYELPEIQEFREARQQFRDDLPAVLENLRAVVVEAEAGNSEYQEAARLFLELCRQSISPDVTNDNVREMLIQHILTKDIFLRVFAEDQFHRENNVARQLDALEGTFFTGNVRREAVDRLRAYYGAVGRAADDIAEYGEKQQFLKAIYEDFYQAYNPEDADRLGVVYTPNEVVDFIIRGADWLLRKHFGKTLGDRNVNILDPATGTGTFVTNLMNYLPADRLDYKYRNEIHANEVEILPYYIANLNIEYTFKELTGRYEEFTNLCFVDTLDNMEWQGASGASVQRQTTLNLGSVSEENWIRVQEQNEKPISVIIGNPPYNANQQNENDNNKNRVYPTIDRRIRETYIRESTAQKTKQYDMYKRFIRWASDRLEDDGVVGFITNRGYLETRQDDGFRQVAAQEFTDIYVVDLGSDVRKNPKISGTTHNVFGIQTGVAIGFFVRQQTKLGICSIHYVRRKDEELATDKLAFLQNATMESIDFDPIVPDAKSYWLDQSHSGFEQLLPLANRETKLAKSVADERAVFNLYSMGVVTNRDEWVYDFDQDQLGIKVRSFINEYEESRALHGGKQVDDSQLGTTIKWTRDLKRQLRLDSPNLFDRESVRLTLFRPFVTKYLYFDQSLNEMQYQLPEVFPKGTDQENVALGFCVNGKSFYVLATDRVVDLHFTGDTQCLPFRRYTEDGRRVSNITEWGLRRINEHYRNEWGEYFDSAYPDGITAEDVFAYAYAVLHDPVYRHDYRVDLLREFPRLPLYHDFDTWAKMGHELLDLHIGFESAEPYPLARRDRPSLKPYKTRLLANTSSGVITLDDGTTVTTLTGIPEDAWRYRLGSRSALEWVLDQYKERKPRDPTIRERFSAYRFADYKEQVIDLLRRVCTVSVKTMDVVDDMAYWEDGHLIVFGDRDKHERSMLGLQAMFSRYEDEDWEAEWSET